MAVPTSAGRPPRGALPASAAPASSSPRTSATANVGSTPGLGTQPPRDPLTLSPWHRHLLPLQQSPDALVAVGSLSLKLSMLSSASVALTDNASGSPLYCGMLCPYMTRLKWQFKGVPEAQHPLFLSQCFTFQRGGEQGECNWHVRSVGILSLGVVVLSTCLISCQHPTGSARVIK